jgi:small subunit ribosomal protein S7
LIGCVGTPGWCPPWLVLNFEDEGSMAYKRFTKSAEQLSPDTRYGSRLVAKFINCMMYAGKKSTATRMVYGAMDIIAKRVKDKPPLEVFETAIENCKPNIEVRSKRVGGSNYQVPIPVNRKRQQSLAFRWIRDACRGGRKGRPTCEILAQELMDAFRGEGNAMTTRDNVHRMAEANKAFAHFARF